MSSLLETYSEEEVNHVASDFTSLQEQEFWDLYNPTEQLGSGAFGEVVAAIRIEDDHPVAVKTMMRSCVSYGVNEEGKSVPKEVLALSQVAEVEGAINLLDWVETEDKVILVMELPPDSINLADYLYTYGFVPEFIAADMMRQIVSTVIEMKAVNVLHRDLKLENILVEKDTGNLKIIDFGLTSTFSSLQQTTMMTSMGSPQYHAPEMVEQKKFIAGPGMVWALGVIAFALLTAKLPFKIGSKRNLAKLKFPSQIYAVPSCFDFLKKCFVREPEGRVSLDALATHPWLAEPSNSSVEISRLESLSQP